MAPLPTIVFSTTDSTAGYADNYAFSIRNGEVDLLAMVAPRRRVRADHKLTLRAAILAAYQHATRGVDLGEQHDAHCAMPDGDGLDHNQHYGAFLYARLGDMNEVDYLNGAAVRGTETGEQHDAHVALWHAPADDHVCYFMDDKRPAIVARRLASVAFIESLPPIPVRNLPKRRPTILRSFAALAIALPMLFSASLGAVADPTNYPAPSNAELHSPIYRAAVRWCSAHKFTMPHYEGHGEWNCAPKRSPDGTAMSAIDPAMLAP